MATRPGRPLSTAPPWGFFYTHFWRDYYEHEGFSAQCVDECGK